MIWPRVARGAALGLAAMGVVDPALTSMRPSKPVVAVIEAESFDPVAHRTADRMASRLDQEYRVVRGAFSGAAAVIAVGDAVPDIEMRDDAVAIAVTPDRPGPRVTIEDLQAPDRASFDGRVPVTARVHAVAASGRHVEVTLSSDGLVIDRVRHDVKGADERFAASLVSVPARAGLASLRVTAQVVDESGNDATAVVDQGVEIEKRRWTVLFLDRRPSWTSTFVRRALDGDSRFAVTARIATSKDVTTDIGHPPASLVDLSELAAFDAVVVGAPDALTAGEEASLEAFARARGGAVVLLMEQPPNGLSGRLTTVGRWLADTRATPVDVGAIETGSGRLQATEIAWPERLPAGAESLATTPTDGHPVVWRMPIGSGRLVVSGALDAWRFRAAAGSTFDRFWRAVIGATADQSPPSVSVELDDSLVPAGTRGRFTATLRDWDAGGRTTVEATVAGVGGPVDLPVWQEATPGRVSGSIPTEARPGAYRLRVTSGSADTEVPFVVAAEAHRARPDARGLLAAWTATRRGQIVPESRMDDVATLLHERISGDTRLQTWHPMRSPWWIAPMTFLLGSEWWWRRRRGLR